jgi:hypothetical protein
MSRARECERGSNSERAFVVANKTGEVNIKFLCLTQALDIADVKGAGRAKG